MRFVSRCLTIRILQIGLLLLACAGTARAEVAREVLQRVADATVYIETQVVLAASDWNALPPKVQAHLHNKRPQGPASGTGFLISQDGLIVTNAHVVSEIRQPMKLGEKTEETVIWRFVPSTFKVVVHSGEANEKIYAPKIIKVDERLDLALLKIDRQPEIQPLKLNPLLKVETGCGVIMAGFPGGKVSDMAPFADAAEIARSEKNPRVSINAGMVTAVREQEHNVRYQLDVRANHGNSGGPITNAVGEVVGVLYAGIDGMQSINYAIPAWYLRHVLPLETLADWGPGFQESAGGNQDYEAFKDSGTFKLK